MTEIESLKLELSELAKSLKPQHLLIAQGMAAGKSQDQAYIDAGGKGKGPRQSASQIILTNIDIQKYIDLAKQIAVAESQSQLIATYDQKRKMLWDIANRASVLKATLKGSSGFGDDEDGEGGLEVFDATAAKTAISAIAELNKMDGDLKPVQTENLHLHKNELLTGEELDDRIAQLQRKAGITVPA